jgi:hypothetical protein
MQTGCGYPQTASTWRLLRLPANTQRRVEWADAVAFTTFFFRWFYHTQDVNEEKLFFGLSCEAGGVGAVGVVLDRVQ